MNRKYLKYILFILSILGIILSAYLWKVQLQGEDLSIPCTTNGGCELVLTSKWSKIFGVPMSVYGFFFYAFLALLTFQRIFIEHKLIEKLTLLSIVWGIIFSVYLRYLEFAKIGAHCTWCWISVLIIVLMAIVLSIDTSSEKKS
ncbi:vitamin K epoxide reductase family protein [Candidatus Dojkabacteria bacterium]|uniref:Vitamin K epoxide reductase family protein n=1 Tax=Candidatus Dojkabacteria bacterium TaxID=2099670 RepID=A0A955RJ03_9BACT|nr:vitamin K epoxide reductase family protein [Candidatus Dojkabacteria bacterium]